jgi:RNA polymerase subunit RPABC4/transcription elongation factor Spt4
MTPDYVICLECESPVYVFEWKDGVLEEAHCALCGNDDVTQFITESDYEEMSMDHRYAPES